MTWPKATLNKIADLCLGKMLDQKKNKGQPRPYLGNLNVRWGSFDLADLKEMRFEDKELERYGLRAGDIVMCEGGEPGRCALWSGQRPEMMIQKALHRIRPHDGVDSRFLYYCLLLKGVSGEFERYFTGATIKHLPGEQLAKVEVEIPPMQIQRRIASILGAYDDLIEVNRRRVAVLEEMARGLFEEWFVRFRFPGHETVPMLDTPDGPLPEGWCWGVLEDMLVLQRGYDLPNSQRADGAVPVISTGGVHGTHSTSMVTGPGVVTGRSGTIGRVQLVMDDFWPLNTTLYVKTFKKAGPAYATLLLRHLQLEKSSTGSAVPTLNRNHVHGLRVPISSEPQRRKFEAIAMDIYKLADILHRQSSTLAASRDLLLPRLISGELSVASAESELEEVA